MAYGCNWHDQSIWWFQLSQGLLIATVHAKSRIGESKQTYNELFPNEQWPPTASKGYCYRTSAQTKSDWLISGHVDLDKWNVSCRVTTEKLLPSLTGYVYKCSKWSRKFRKKVFLAYEKNIEFNREEKYSTGNRKYWAWNAFNRFFCCWNHLFRLKSSWNIVVLWMLFTFSSSLYNKTFNAQERVCFVFPRISMFPSSSSISENKTNYFPREHYMYNV
jgi:hypothetical protein